MKFELSQESRQSLARAVQAFFLEDRDESIGFIAADRIVGFFVDTLGTAIYNSALDDARVWFSHRLESVELDYEQLYRREGVPASSGDSTEEGSDS